MKECEKGEERSTAAPLRQESLCGQHREYKLSKKREGGTIEDLKQHRDMILFKINFDMIAGCFITE